ncbi:MAG: heavy metal response regulator transcription factor [Syntrophobacteraceae bacterium]|nr:heavy metal response regulator transcription factor [Syntrophobacteraceae bacterium]
MRILIVEDNKMTSSYVSKGLAEKGFIVDVAENGEEGLHLATTEPYDLVILDVMLPRKSGWSIVKDLRSQNKETPVIFLTARDAVCDRIKGLDLGADDYLVKPFAFSELLARIRSLLRRAPLRQSDVFCVADLEIDITRHKATRSGRPLDLTPKEFLLLELLARRTTEVLSKNYIAGQVWGILFDSDSNPVEVAVGRLRKKVDDPFAVSLIHTVRGVGYVLEQR